MYNQRDAKHLLGVYGHTVTSIAKRYGLTTYKLKIYMQRWDESGHASHPGLTIFLNDLQLLRIKRFQDIINNNKK